MMQRYVLVSMVVASGVGCETQTVLIGSTVDCPSVVQGSTYEADETSSLGFSAIEAIPSEITVVSRPTDTDSEWLFTLAVDADPGADAHLEDWFAGPDAMCASGLDGTYLVMPVSVTAESDGGSVTGTGNGLLYAIGTGPEEAWLEATFPAKASAELASLADANLPADCTDRTYTLGLPVRKDRPVANVTGSIDVTCTFRDGTMELTLLAW